MQAKFMCFETTPTNKNGMHEEFKSKLNSDNAALPIRQNLLSSCSLSNYLSIKNCLSTQLMNQFVFVQHRVKINHFVPY